MAHYSGSVEIQPAFILSDLEATCVLLTEHLGEQAFQSHVTLGRALSQPEAVSIAVRALNDVIDHLERKHPDA
jgi:hypothetical protein